MVMLVYTSILKLGRMLIGFFFYTLISGTASAIFIQERNSGNSVFFNMLMEHFSKDITILFNYFCPNIRLLKCFYVVYVQSFPFNFFL